MKRGRIIQAYELAGIALALIEQPSGYLQLIYKNRDRRPKTLGTFEYGDEALSEFHSQAAELCERGRLENI